MPRFTSASKISLKDKLVRANRYRVFGYKNWSDPFPLTFGTLPEKLLYSALSKRGINFLYLNDLEIKIPELDFDQWFQADFILPDLRIIIEVQGAHWHSMPSTIEADALKFAYYVQMGWRPLAWWDFDIIADINRLFAADPVLSAYSSLLSSSSELPVVRRTKTDSSKGIRTLNARRAARLVYRKKAASVKSSKSKVFGKYGVYGK